MNWLGLIKIFFSVGGDSLKFFRFYELLPFGLKHDLSFFDLLGFQTIHDLALFFESNQEEMAISSKSIDHLENVKSFLGTIDQHKSHMNIAIIGMAGRFPGSENIETFWDNIKNGVFSLTQFTREELLEAGHDSALISDQNYVSMRGFLKNFKEFDADFFEFTPREAQIMDPQHRLFLELGWEVLESAGYTPTKTKYSIGTYAGVSYNEYFSEHLIPNNKLWDQIGSMPIVIGNSADNFSTKVAYRLGITGPAITVSSGMFNRIDCCAFSQSSYHGRRLPNGNCWGGKLERTYHFRLSIRRRHDFPTGW